MNKLTNITTFSATVATVALLHCSCKEKGEVQHFRTPKTAKSTSTAKTPQSTQPAQPAEAAASETSSATKAPYTWTLPAGWSAKPASGMRLATIIIPSNGKSLDASVTEFGGTLAGNVNRWRGQIGLPPLEESAIPATLKEIKTGMGNGYIVTLLNPATPDNALLAAIIPRPSGTSVFVKVPCSSSELETITAPFTRFAQSLSASQ